MDEKGFTLIEVVLVIAIMGIISTIAVPSFKRYQLNARVVAHNATVNTLKAAGTIYFIDNPDEKETKDNFKEYLDKKSDLFIDKFIARKLELTNEEFSVSNKDNNIEVNPGILVINSGEIEFLKDSEKGNKDD